MVVVSSGGRVPRSLKSFLTTLLGDGKREVLSLEWRRTGGGEGPPSSRERLHQTCVVHAEEGRV